MLQKKSNGNEAAKYIRIAVLLIYDILAVFLAEIISIWTRFEFSLKNEQCIPFFGDCSSLFLDQCMCHACDFCNHASV